MNYRTDLALETRQILEEQEQCGGPKTTGFIQKTRQLDKEISLTHITITDKEGELAFGKPKGNYIPEKMVNVIVLKQYRDMELDRVVKEGEELEMPEDRAKEIEGAGYLKIKEA